jgi:phosphomevalonate kinase
VIHAAARAPGKLVLTGEYAVLRGAPALVAAVDRFAEVRVALAPEPGPLAVESRAEGEHWLVREIEAEELTGGDLGAVLAALRVASAWAPPLAGRRTEVRVDSSAFLADGKKLGLGRSAATVTAAVAAFLAAAGHRDREETCEAAIAAHALFQEGRGSGADVAASVRGGVIEFRRSAGRLAIGARALPPGLDLVVGWTGESMPTDPLLKRFAASAATHEPPALGELCASAERAAAAVAAGDVASFTAAVATTAELLERLAHEVGIPIVTPALARLVETARRAGAVAKPSGAGGGDCGIAFARSSAQADAVRAAWRAAGIVPLPLAIAADGVRHELREAPASEVSLG